MTYCFLAYYILPEETFSGFLKHQPAEFVIFLAPLRIAALAGLPPPDFQLDHQVAGLQLLPHCGHHQLCQRLAEKRRLPLERVGLGVVEALLGVAGVWPVGGGPGAGWRT